MFALLLIKLMFVTSFTWGSGRTYVVLLLAARPSCYVANVLLYMKYILFKPKSENVFDIWHLPNLGCGSLRCLQIHYQRSTATVFGRLFKSLVKALVSWAQLLRNAWCLNVCFVATNYQTASFAWNHKISTAKSLQQCFNICTEPNGSLIFVSYIIYANNRCLLSFFPLFFSFFFFVLFFFLSFF